MGAVLSFQGQPSPIPEIVFGRAHVHALVDRAVKITRIPRRDIIGPTKLHDACVVRFAVILAAREAGKSLTQIGRVLGGRDHTTILAAERRAREFERAEPDFAELMRRLREVAL